MAKFTEVAKPGMAYAARLHAAGCADIAKDRRRGYTDRAGWNGTIQGWKEMMFGDVAGDSYDQVTERAEWLQEVDYQATEATILPCAVAAEKAEIVAAVHKAATLVHAEKWSPTLF